MMPAMADVWIMTMTTVNGRLQDGEAAFVSQVWDSDDSLRNELSAGPRNRQRTLSRLRRKIDRKATNGFKQK